MKTQKLTLTKPETTITDSLISKVRDFFLPYYNKNDIAHNIEHADAVCYEALRINKLCNSLYDEKIVVIAAYAHDMFAYRREYHHILARNFIIETDSFLVSDLTQEEIWLIATACFEHRSAIKPSDCKLSDIIKSADKGKPNITSFIKRSFSFLNGSNLSLEEKIEDVVVCLINTFSRHKGVFKPSSLYLKVYNNELKDFYQSLESLSSDFVSDILYTELNINAKQRA